MSRYPFPHTRKLEHLCYPSLAKPEDALRAFQASIGAPADGFASSDVLDRLRSR